MDDTVCACVRKYAHGCAHAHVRWGAGEGREKKQAELLILAGFWSWSRAVPTLLPHWLLSGPTRKEAADSKAAMPCPNVHSGLGVPTKACWCSVSLTRAEVAQVLGEQAKGRFRSASLGQAWGPRVPVASHAKRPGIIAETEVGNRGAWQRARAMGEGTCLLWTNQETPGSWQRIQVFTTEPSSYHSCPL